MTEARQRAPARRMTRRRALTLMAAAAGLPLLARDGRTATGAAPRFVWWGTVLGARAELVVAHPDAAAARRAAAF
jgi:thiamine biosynthesis lipoprotein